MNHKKFSNNLKKAAVYVALYVFTIIIVISAFILKPTPTWDYPILRGVIIFFCTILLTKYFFYMLLSPWYDIYTARKKKKYELSTRRYKPMVSVLIPAWNESCGIIRTMETVLKSTYTNMELVVINDGSTDDSDKLINEFIKSYKILTSTKKLIPIVYQYQQNGGKGAALNKAVSLSHGDILLTIDADCAVMPDTIENFVRHFRDRKVMAAVGNVKVGNNKHLLGVIQQLEFLFSFYFKKADSLMNTIYIIGGAAGAFRREVFEKIGGFNTTNITEDIDLSVRIQKAGMKTVYADDAIVYTEGASEIKGLLKQRLRWKRGRFETFFQHSELFFSDKKEHNKILTWLILPFACLAEVQLSMELGFLAFLYIYSYLIHDFSSFIPGILIVSCMFFVQILFDDTQKAPGYLYFLAPIGWLLFYLATFVEVSALVNSVLGLVQKKKITWQKWERVGVDG